MSDTLPEGALLAIRMMVRLPCAATVDDIREWVALHAAGTSHIRSNSPLYDEEMIAFSPTDFAWSDTGFSGREVNVWASEVPGGPEVQTLTFARETRR